MINLINLDTDQKVNSGFGQRVSPTAGASTNHKGIDVTLKDPNIPSILGGTVSYVGYSDSGGYTISIDQNDGTVATYMHMATSSPLSVGDIVNEGDIIGVQGSTGISTGNHVHLQITKNGTYLDPAGYMNVNSKLEGVNLDNSFSSTGVGNTVPESGLKETALDIVGKAITFVVILLVFILAVYLFMKAFDIKVF